MQLKLIHNKNIEEVDQLLTMMNDFDDWDALLSDIPDTGILNNLTFEQLIDKIEPTINKHSKTPMRARYVVTYLKFYWDLCIEDNVTSIRQAYINLLYWSAEANRDTPKLNPGLELVFSCIYCGLMGENNEKIEAYVENNKDI